MEKVGLVLYGEAIWSEKPHSRKENTIKDKFWDKTDIDYILIFVFLLLRSTQKEMEDSAILIFLSIKWKWKTFNFGKSINNFKVLLVCRCYMNAYY